MAMTKKVLLKKYIQEALQRTNEMKLGVAGRHSFDVAGLDDDMELDFDPSREGLKTESEDQDDFEKALKFMRQSALSNFCQSCGARVGSRHKPGCDDEAEGIVSRKFPKPADVSE